MNDVFLSLIFVQGNVLELSSKGSLLFRHFLLVQGYLYQLDDHLDRFYVSAHKAAIVPPFSRPQLRRIILETAAASQKFDGRLQMSINHAFCEVSVHLWLTVFALCLSPKQHSMSHHMLQVLCSAASIRYWLGAGQGGFGISPLECLQPSFYCMVYQNRDVPDHSKVGLPAHNPIQ